MKTELSPLALAFIGDAIHTAYVREEVLKGKNNKLSNYHNLAKRYCNAKRQMQSLEAIFDILTDEEKEVVRRARNSHSKHTAKNFDEETYKKATAFEALVGHLYMTNQIERLKKILEISMKEE